MMRRPRSRMRRADCIKALAAFAPKVKRFMESSGAAGFAHGPGTDGQFCERGHINVMFLVRGGFGVAGDIMEAIRVLAGHVIAADDKHPRKPTPPREES